jgi:hypothetical protein
MSRPLIFGQRGRAECLEQLVVVVLVENQRAMLAAQRAARTPALNARAIA